MKNLKFLLVLLASLTLLNACDSAENSSRSLVDPELTTYLSIDTDIIQPQCLECHGPTNAYDLSSLQSITASGTVVPNQPNESSFYTTVASVEVPHPDDPLTPLEIERIRLWILNGAGISDTGSAVDAGADQNIILENVASAVFNAVAADGVTIESYAWTTDSTLPHVLAGENTAQLTVTNYVAGTYEFILSATDTAGVEIIDTVNLIVTSSAANMPPVVDAGFDQTVILPTNTATFVATASDPDGAVASFAWTQLTGPLTAVLAGADTDTLQLSGLVNDVYSFRVTVTDNLGATTFDDVTLTVERATPSFATLKTTVFDPKCARCHMNGNNSGGYAMNNYAETITEVVPNQPLNSSLFVRTNNNSMPPLGAVEQPLSAQEKADLRLWIERGAPNN